METLWDIFVYSIELVNASQAQPLYEIMDTKVGEQYDTSVHTASDDSAAQGSVVEVLLRGYKNTFTNKIIKKSIVKAG